MKERPIPFKAPMVRAILDGSKTQTRRVMKFQPTEPPKLMKASLQKFGGKPVIAAVWGEHDCCLCPYGIVEDRLWVRETWRVGAWQEDEGAIAVDYKSDGFSRREWLRVADGGEGEELFSRLWMQSTDDAVNALGQQERYKWEPGQSPCRWRSSRFMPRWASRITLEITGVRVERLQDISEDDAEAEGIEGINQPTGGDDYQDYWRNYGLTEKQADGWPWFTGDRIASYKSLWESINGPGSWDVNPWVWVIEFKMVM